MGGGKTGAEPCAKASSVGDGSSMVLLGDLLFAVGVRHVVGIEGCTKETRV